MRIETGGIEFRALEAVGPLGKIPIPILDRCAVFLEERAVATVLALSFAWHAEIEQERRQYERERKRRSGVG